MFRSPRRAIGKASVLLLLVGLGVLRSHVGMRLDSFTVDEPWHIVAGTSYARSGDFHLNPEHPPLIKLCVGAAMPSDFKLRAPAVQRRSRMLGAAFAMTIREPGRNREGEAHTG